MSSFQFYWAYAISIGCKLLTVNGFLVVAFVANSQFDM